MTQPVLEQIRTLLRAPRGHALISAAPGAGKTHTLMQIAREHEAFGIRALAFNRHNAQELRGRLPERCDVRTLHSSAVGLLYSSGLHYSPCVSIASSCALEMFQLFKSTWPDLSREDLRKRAFGLAFRYNAYLLRADFKETFTPRQLEKVLQEKGELTPRKWSALLQALHARREAAYQARKACKEKPDTEFRLSFTETLYYALKRLEGRILHNAQTGNDLRTKPFLILLDELQDSSPLALKMVVASLGSAGRLIAVGDPRQNIMGFAGAAPDAYGTLEVLLGRHEADTLKRARAAEKKSGLRKTQRKPVKAPKAPVVTHLELGRSRRVPTRHAQLAHHVFARHGAARFASFDGTPTPGGIYQLESWQLPDVLESGDRVLCRTAIPLVKLSLKLLEPSMRGPLKIRLRLGTTAGELKRILVKVLEAFDRDLQVSGNGPYMDSHTEEDDASALLQAAIKRVTHVTQNPTLDDDEIQPNEDGPLELARTLLLGLLECTNTYYDANELKRHLNQHVDALLSSEEGILLSTIHGAKGSEAARVFVLHPTKLPSEKLVYDPQEEERLRFVAFTRSFESLILVPGEGEDLRELWPEGMNPDPGFPAPATKVVVQPELQTQAAAQSQTKPTRQWSPARSAPLPSRNTDQQDLFGQAPTYPTRVTAHSSRSTEANSGAPRSFTALPTSSVRTSGLRLDAIKRASLEARAGLEASRQELSRIEAALGALLSGDNTPDANFVARHLERHSQLIRTQQEKYRQKCALYERELALAM